MISSSLGSTWKKYSTILLDAVFSKTSHILKWLFLNDPQLKAVPFTLGSLCRLYGLEQDLSFILGNSINPASI